MPTQTRRQLGEERQHLLASELPGNDDLALGIDAVDLEDLLCKVEPDGGNYCHGRPPLVIRHQRSLYGPQMPRGAPSTSSPFGPVGAGRIELQLHVNLGSSPRLAQVSDEQLNAE